MHLRTRLYASQGVMPTKKAQQVLGLFVGLFVALVASNFLASSAWAQFDKTRWPSNAATPKIDAPDLQGKTWSASELAGKVVVLNFWATWCAPCKEELPTLQTLHEISDNQTVVLTINVRESSARAVRYMQTTGMTFPVISDPQGELAKRWGVTVYPTTVLIAPNGQARWRVMGDVDWSGAQANQWLTELRHDGGAASPASTPKHLKR